MSRSEAKERGESKYYTGQPCKNGHVTYRYTQSGTCASCIKAANSPVDSPAMASRKAATLNMVQVKVRAFVGDVEAVKGAALGFAVLREPLLTIADVFPPRLPQDFAGGTYLYRFNCHIDDVEPFRKLAADICNATAKRNINIEAERQRIHGAAYVATAPKDDGWPADHWK